MKTNPYSPPSTKVPLKRIAAPAEQPLASRGQRFYASLIDTIIISCPFLLLFYIPSLRPEVLQPFILEIHSNDLLLSLSGLVALFSMFLSTVSLSTLVTKPLEK